MEPEVLVSISTLSYNHSEYIRDCLDGIVKQKTKFKFELLIHDDASTDGTEEIIREYEKKYPDIIKPVYEKENQWVKGKRGSAAFNFPRAKGKYIALCEGDDYWVDQYKLQKQVDFLEKNSNCNYVFTRKKNLSYDGDIIPDKYISTPKVVNLDFLLKNNIMPPTQTVLFRKSSLPSSYPTFIYSAINIDWVLLFLITHNSKIGFIDEVTAVYRQGVGIIKSTNMILKMKNGIETNKAIDKYTNYKYHYHLKNKSWHYQNITYGYLEERKILKAWYYFFLKLADSLKNNPRKFFSSNKTFFKHTLKHTFQKP